VCVLHPVWLEAALWKQAGQREGFTSIVWEHNLASFDSEGYTVAVERLLESFETHTHISLTPGDRGRVGIKVFTESGSGLATPRPLTWAVITALIKRGYSKKDIFILDISERLLRQSRYIPPLSRKSEGDQFHGVPVYALDTGDFYDDLWYYENPLPSLHRHGQFYDLAQALPDTQPDEDRKSYLPKPLLTDIDFWINLPMVTDHPAIGVNGALVNATLLSISNRDRFFLSPSIAPVAAAEIAAIPELLSNWAFTIVSLERYQFIGGPTFNSLYTRSEPLLWMSINPVLIDALMLERMEDHRKREGFPLIETPSLLLNYAESLGLGTQRTDHIAWIRLP